MFADAIYDLAIDELACAFKDNSEELRIFGGQHLSCPSHTSHEKADKGGDPVPPDFISNRPDLTPAVVYGEIIDWVLSEEGQEKGGLRGVFKRVDESTFVTTHDTACRSCPDIYSSFSGLHSNLAEGQIVERMCLPCSDDLLACGLYEWWARKRPQVFDQLDKTTRAKPNCKNGRACYRQGNSAHSRKFNHICTALVSLRSSRPLSSACESR